MSVLSKEDDFYLYYVEYLLKTKELLEIILFRKESLHIYILMFIRKVHSIINHEICM